MHVLWYRNYHNYVEYFEMIIFYGSESGENIVQLSKFQINNLTEPKTGYTPLRSKGLHLTRMLRKNSQSE